MKKLAFSLFCAAFLSVSGFSSAHADDSDQLFFRTLEGTWSGPGEIVTGKYKGTRFICNFAGLSGSSPVGMTLDGSCRVGVFSQPMRATIIRGTKGFSGAFNDGAKGSGFDVTSGRIGTDHMVFELNRKKLNGAMIARLLEKNKLNITLSVSIRDQLVPVVGLTLKRTSTSIPRDFARK